jgi:hypothetical protein
MWWWWPIVGAWVSAVGHGEADWGNGVAWQVGMGERERSPGGARRHGFAGERATWIKFMSPAR